MNTHQSSRLLLGLIILCSALHTATAQTVHVDFTAEITNITGNPLPGAQVGGTIQGRITVDLAHMPEDPNPDKQTAEFNYYTAEAGPFPGYTFEFDAGLGSTIQFDSIEAANTPGPTPGIFMYDTTGSRDWIGFQARSTGSTYTASLSFEDYTFTNGLVTTDYFPEAIHLPGDKDRAGFYYGDFFGSDTIAARVTTATLTVDTGSQRTGLLQYRIQRSDLPRYKKLILLNTLRLAEIAFARKRCYVGLKHLEHFQRKLRLLIPRRDANLAYVLRNGAAQIIADGCDQISE